TAASIANAASINFEQESIKVFPNPARSKITIKHNVNINIKSVVFYNVLGEQVMKIHDGFDSIDVSQLSSALYFVKIKSDVVEINKRLIIKK
ncbi:MAG: T9SS type A sorting domain-containing protein, partial [Flavobacteriaceae bacterium]